MTIARAFQGLRYDTERVELSSVIVPPYDVIAAEERATFYERDPYNAIRFELTREVADEADAQYTDVREVFESWCQNGVLCLDDVPGYYVLRQRFGAPDGQMLERIGFFAELQLADYSERIVRPHERTMAGPKADRLKLLRATRANLSSVFLLYEDRQEQIAALLADALASHRLADAKDDAGVEYTLAALTEPAAVEALGAFMEESSVVIADGHHRYETALAYRDEERAKRGSTDSDSPSESILAYFANAYAPGSLLLPIHRVVRECAFAEPPDAEAWREALPGWQEEQLEITDVGAIPGLLSAALEPLASKPAFAADDGRGVLRIFWQPRELGEELMVRILERDVLGKVFSLEPEAIRAGAVSFPKSTQRAAEEVRSGEGCVALYLNPLHPDDVFRVTAAGEVMPQKSTFFYPKIPTGFVFRDHRD